MQKISIENRTILEEKYKKERDKRIRSEGTYQYGELKGKFAYLDKDPYTPYVKREPLTDHVTFAFVGGGFAGLCIAARLREAGIHDLRIIEDGGDFGGVWYWNRYPGAMCDTASLIYLPFLEETGYMPTMKYVTAPEIWEHAIRIAKHYHLYERALFSTHINQMTWNEEKKHWMIETNRGDRMTAKYISMGTGPVSRPKLPGIPGIESFSGHSFHTCRWDYAYTGGSYEGAPMVKLGDKKVGIIGTGSTAVQCVPPLGRDSKGLYVFQRTPSAIDERKNYPINPTWYSKLGKEWQKEWMRNFAALHTCEDAGKDLVNDGWTEIFLRICNRMTEEQSCSNQITPESLLAAYKDTDDLKMEQLRQRVNKIVRDPKTAEELKAWYRQLCKRPCFHDDYLPTFNLPNVHLVDTDGKGIERIDATGAWVNGKHYDLDCIIYASGFEISTDYTRRSSFEIFGRNGLTLTEKWANGIETYQGMFVRGFPNMFIISLCQAAALGTNVTSNYMESSLTLAAVIKHAETLNSSEVETSEKAEADWVKAIENAPESIFGGSDCTPGFYNNEGQPLGRRGKLYMGGYPLGPAAFFEYIDKWRNSGEFTGLEFH